MNRQPKRRDKKPAGRILYFDSWQQKNGTTRYRWKPSPRLRKLGWKNIDLGTDERTAINAAITRNAELALWEQGRPMEIATVQKPISRATATFGDLVHEFRQDMLRRSAFPRQHEEHLTAKTCRQYHSQLNSLMSWAEDGATRVDAITSEMCEDLRKALVNHATDFTTAARLRMLRQLMNFAVKPLKVISNNPMDDVTIPTPKPRSKRASIDAIEWLAEFAETWVGQDARGGPNLACAVLMGFYTTQREGDLLSAIRMNWRPIDDVDHYDRAALSVGGVAPMGLRILQSKTQKRVTSFVPPEVAARIDDLIASRGGGWDGNLLLEDSSDGAVRQWPEWRFQRDYRTMRIAAEAAAEAAGDSWLASELANLQFRDMRRSGMCWMRDMGASVPQIANISGHSIAYTTKILDTYLPGDPRGAAAGLASAIRTRASRPTGHRKMPATKS